MKNILFLDWNNVGADYLDEFFDESKVILSEVFTRNGEGIDAIQIPLYEGWDYLVTPYGDNDFLDMIEYLLKIGVPKERIISISGEGIWAENMAEIADLLTDYWNAVAMHLANMKDFHSKAMGDYVAVTAEGMTFANSASDECIMYSLYSEKKMWSKDEMEKLREIAEKRFKFRDEQNIFCDIGANIGTTSIYFKKKLDNDIHILAFEPAKENYKLYRINALFNDVKDEDLTLVNCALSDTNGECEFEYDPLNPGASKVVTESDKSCREVVKLVTFDDFVRDNDIDIQKIKYIWVDVEGHEPAFIRGAKETLKKINVPIMMEFSAKDYYENGVYKQFVADLEEIYDTFIIVESENQKEYDIKQLYALDAETGQFDVFLFKKQD